MLVCSPAHAGSSISSDAARQRVDLPTEQETEQNDLLPPYFCPLRRSLFSSVSAEGF